MNEVDAAVMQASGGVGGPQTAPRAELMAALWVAEGSAGLVPAVTDCEYVRAGAAALRQPVGAEAEPYLHGTGGDLWARMLVVLPRVRWVPAHRPALGGPRSPRPIGQRGKAAALRMERLLYERWAAALAALRVLHDVYGAVEVAAWDAYLAWCALAFRPPPLTRRRTV